MAGVFTERLLLKSAAIVFALMLWLVVSAQESAEAFVPVRLELMADSSVQLVGPLPEVEALVVGRGRELLKLYARRPVIRRTIRADVGDRLALRLRLDDVDVPAGIEARVREVRPRLLSLRLRRTAVPSVRAERPSVDTARTLDSATSDSGDTATAATLP